MVGFNFLPQDDQSEFLVGITAPEGWSLEKTNEVFSQITRRVVAWPEVVDVMEIVGDIRGRQAEGEGPVNVGNIYVRLVDLEEREGDWSQADIMDRARQLLRDYPDLRASVSVPAQVQAGGANADVQFQLMGPDLDQLQSYADKMVAQLRQVPGLVDVDTTLTGRKPELRVEVDRERAADLGVDIRTISSTLGALVGGRIVTDYRDAQMGELYDVWLRAEGVDRSDPEAVRNLTVPAEGGELIRLGSVADTLPGQGPSQIDRADRQRTINLIANLNGLPGATASEEFYRAFESLGAPPTYSLQPTGRAKEEARSVMAFVMAFVFSLIFMYMVLAAQFESFVHPITILLAVPLTIPFALITLIALGEPLTLFAVLGLFLLFGIVKKNGILQVDYSNVLRRNASDDPSIVPAPYRPVSPSAAGDDRRGISRWEKWVSGRGDDERVRLWAILEANRVRLRPILMTTFMLVTAMIPIALGEGPGAANRAAVAKVIIGGQSLSLLLSLLVTPVAYSLFDDVQLWFGRRFRRERRAVIRSSELGDLAPAVSRLEPHPAPYSGNGDSLRE
jgi:HAE1 family hydrophobic/amphiphilic exporter-1